MAAQNAIEKSSGNSLDGSRHSSVYVPNVDVLETTDEIMIVADVPGTTSDDIDVRYENGELTLHARVAERNPGNAKCLLRQYGVGHFNRVFQVNEQIETGKISADYSGGVLTVRLPKVEAAKPHTIKVVSSD